MLLRQVLEIEVNYFIVTQEPNIKGRQTNKNKQHFKMNSNRSITRNDKGTTKIMTQRKQCFVERKVKALGISIILNEKKLVL